jgi:two-component system, NtrC family, sensor histidine kinase HydH
MRTRKKTKPARGKRKHSKRANPSSAQVGLRRKARFETIGEVAAVLAHESRNLLGALGTCVQVLRRNPHLSSDDAELLDIIQSGANRLNEIVDQFSAFRAGTSPQMREVNLHEIIDATLASLQRDERCSSSIVVQRRFDTSLSNMAGDGDQLRLALWHLFLNAVQAMSERGQLQVQTENIGRQVEISVRDTGPGIPKNVSARMFEPLYTTKTRGAGLGLTIVRRVVEAHGGAVTVHSEPGKGASFTLRLPLGAK